MASIAFSPLLTSSSSLRYLTGSLVESFNPPKPSPHIAHDNPRIRDVSLSSVSTRSSRIVTLPAPRHRPSTCYALPRRRTRDSDVKATISGLATDPDTQIEDGIAMVKKALKDYPEELCSLLTHIRSLCFSSRAIVRCAGYQLIQAICDTHGPVLSEVERRYLWSGLSRSKLENERSALESQLDSLSTFIECLGTSLLLGDVFKGLLSWLPDGSDVGDVDFDTFKKCDNLLAKIVEKNAALLEDDHFSEIIERYCSSARCALQDGRFHGHVHGAQGSSSASLNSVHHPPHIQPTLTIEERAARLLDTLEHVQRYAFVPEQSFPILVRTICRLSYHFNICVASSKLVAGTSRDVPLHLRALNWRLVTTAKRLLEDRNIGGPAFEAIVLPGRHYDWRFAVGAIYIARGIVWDALSEAPTPIQHNRIHEHEHRYETTVHLDYWMQMLRRIPSRWWGKVRGDKVLVELSYMIEDMIVFCEYHQSSETSVFVGETISGLAEALKNFRCELGLKRRFTLGAHSSHPNALIARTERLLSMDMDTVMTPPLVTILISMTEHLCDKSVSRVIVHLLESKPLVPALPGWQSNFQHLLRFFATASQDYPESREAIARYLAEFYNSVADIAICHEDIYEDVVNVWERVLPSETSEKILLAASEILSKEIILCCDVDTGLSDRIRTLWRDVALQDHPSSYRSVIAVKFLIMAFNNFAFPSARQLSLLTLNADRGCAAAMAIKVFKDIIYLVGMNDDATLKGPNLSSQTARLVILQWLLRLRSGARHRIFTVDGPLEEVYPLAKIAYHIDNDTRAMSWGLKAPLDANLFTGTLHQSPTMTTFESFKNEKSKHWLPVSLYVNMICDIIDYDRDWEMVSLILCHLPLQLANKHLFCGPKVSPVIRRLARSVCTSIDNDKLFKQMSGITPSQPRPVDVKAVLYQSLTVLISYRWRLQSNPEDEMGKALLMNIIGSFVSGLGTSVVTGKPCLEALSLCVFALPMVDKFSSNIVERLSRTMTNPKLAIHILEFLLVLGNRPRSGYLSSFRSQDYQRVFRVSLMYIEHHYRPDVPTLRTSDGRDSFALAQHVLNMAFYVMHVWFMKIKTSERPQLIPTITNELVASNGKGPLKPPTVVFLDWLARFAHGNVDPKVPTSPLYRSVVCPDVDENWDYNARHDWRVTYQTEMKNVDIIKAWKLGASIITISTLKKAGWLRIVNRRPSCVVELICHLEGEHVSLYPPSAAPDKAPVVTEPDDMTEDAIDVDEGVLAKVVQHIFQDAPQSYKDVLQPDPISGLILGGQVSYPEPKHAQIDPSLLFPMLTTYPSHKSRRLRRYGDPEQLKMSLSHIDSIPVIDTHKVGVVYVAPGQSTEKEVLGNHHGSPAYSRFLKELGRVIIPTEKLEVYTGGLSSVRHGKYALAWWDDICQVLFHVATFMPTLEREGIEYKKAEIGNDAVKIVWNEGGKPYDINTIPCAFNLINIVIEPHTLMPKAAYQENLHVNGFFKVLLQIHPSLPRVTPIGDFKIVAAEDLPSLVRRYSIIACMFCNSWVTTGQDRGQNIPLETNWQSRLDLINRTEKFLVDEQDDEEIIHGFCNTNLSP